MSAVVAGDAEVLVFWVLSGGVEHPLVEEAGAFGDIKWD